MLIGIRPVELEIDKIYYSHNFCVSTKKPILGSDFYCDEFVGQHWRKSDSISFYSWYQLFSVEIPEKYKVDDIIIFKTNSINKVGKISEIVNADIIKAIVYDRDCNSYSHKKTKETEEIFLFMDSIRLLIPYNRALFDEYIKKNLTEPKIKTYDESLRNIDIEEFV